MKLDTISWKEFILGDYFEIKKGKRLTSKDQINGNTPYIGAINSNNGITNYIGQPPIHDGNTISLSYNGSVGEAFYQPNPFWATDDVNVLYFKAQDDVVFNKYIALFICSILKKEKYRYSYGRKWVLKNMKKTVIKLPSKNDLPDWEYMESYIKSLNYKPITTANKKENILPLKVGGWEEFELRDIFEIKYGINLELINCEIVSKKSEDAVNFIARTSSNNGVVARVKRIPQLEPQPAGIITCAGGGSVLSTFIQTKEFYSGRDLYLLTPKFNMSIYSKLFCCTIIEANKYRFNYGRQANKTMPYLMIKLPVKSDGSPDFEYMDNYIKSLPYSDKI